MMNQSDYISSAPSDIIDIIGSCLTKTESINVGYTNKALYNESHKLSYILKQNPAKLCKANSNDENQNDKISNCDLLKIRIDEHLLNKLLNAAPNTIGIANAYPKTMELGISLDYWDNKWDIFSEFDKKFGSVLESNIFQRFFQRVEIIKIEHPIYLQYIPVNILFKKNNNQVNKAQQPINKIIFEYPGKLFDDENMPSVADADDLVDVVFSELAMASVVKFGQNYQHYFQNHCQKQLSKIRTITSIKLYGILEQMCIIKLLEYICPNFECLDLDCSGFRLENLAQIQALFHYNLQKLICCESYIMLDESINVDWLKLDLSKHNKKEQELQMTASTVSGNCTIFINADYFQDLKTIFNYVCQCCDDGKSSINVADYVKCFQIVISYDDDDDDGNAVLNASDYQCKGLSNLLFGIGNYNDTFFQSLNRLVFTLIDNNQTLSGTAHILAFLIENKEDILDFSRINTVVLAYNYNYDNLEIPASFNYGKYINHSANSLYIGKINENDISNIEKNNDLLKNYLGYNNDDNEANMELECQLNLNDPKCFLIYYKIVNLFQWLMKHCPQKCADGEFPTIIFRLRKIA